MDNFKAVYKILTALERAMDLPQFDIMEVGPEKLGVSVERWLWRSWPFASSARLC